MQHACISLLLNVILDLDWTSSRFHYSPHACKYMLLLEICGGARSIRMADKCTCEIRVMILFYIKSISTFPLPPSIQTAWSSKLELLTESFIESLNDCFEFFSSTKTFFRYKYSIILVLFKGFAMLSDRLIIFVFLYESIALIFFIQII